MTPGVFITFDVECSMGGAWQNPNLKPIPPRLGMMGEYGEKSYGLPMICDILERHGVKATFFLEPFNNELGYPGETEPVCRFLVESGQDVQLHIHPNHVHYGLQREGKPYDRTDDMADLSPARQREMIEAGVQRIENWTGIQPIAFRAGNMGASKTTLEALSQVGVWMDSSYTFPYAGGQCKFPAEEPYNGSKWYGDVLEVSLSGFQQLRVPKFLPAAQPLDLMGASFGECRDAARMICDAGADAVAILHSFSLFRWRDVQYNGGRPNHIVKRRFEKFCKWLAENRNQYPARTFSELGRMVKEDGYEPRSVPPCRLGNLPRSFIRKVVQGMNNIYWF